MKKMTIGMVRDVSPWVTLPGLVIILKPSSRARPIIERAVNRSIREHEPKDFIDLLENVGVLLWLGPAGPEHLAEGDSWRRFIYSGYDDRNLEREIWPGSDGCLFVMIFERDANNGAEIEPWKALMRRMIGKFF